jgi:hypothetical protein
VQSYEVVHDPGDGLVLRLYPPTVTGNYRVEFIPEPLDFSDDASPEWRGPARSDELIVLRTAAKGCRKEGRRGDAADLLSDYRELLERVQASASWVDQRNPARIRDVNAGVARDAFDYPVGRGLDF